MNLLVLSIVVVLILIEERGNDTEMKATLTKLAQVAGAPPTTNFSFVSFTGACRMSFEVMASLYCLLF